MITSAARLVIYHRMSVSRPKNIAPVPLLGVNFDPFVERSIELRSTFWTLFVQFPSARRIRNAAFTVNSELPYLGHNFRRVFASDFHNFNGLRRKTREPCLFEYPSRVFRYKHIVPKINPNEVVNPSRKRDAIWRNRFGPTTFTFRTYRFSHPLLSAVPGCLADSKRLIRV